MLRLQKCRESFNDFSPLNDNPFLRGNDLKINAEAFYGNMMRVSLSRKKYMEEIDKNQAWKSLFYFHFSIDDENFPMGYLSYFFPILRPFFYFENFSCHFFSLNIIYWLLTVIVKQRWYWTDPWIYLTINSHKFTSLRAFCPYDDLLVYNSILGYCREQFWFEFNFFYY